MRIQPRHAACWLIGWLALAAPLAAQVVSRQPADQAVNVCPDTQLALTFAGPPTLGTAGQIRIYDTATNTLVDTLDLSVPPGAQATTIGGFAGFHFYPVLIDGNTATIYPHHHALAYGKTYSVQIDPGVLRDGAGEFAGYGAAATWTFTTKKSPPAADATRLVVAADGTGDFATVQGAVDFAPSNPPQRVTIFIRKGTYREIVYFRDKHDLTFLGEDRAQTIIGYPNNERLNGQAPGTRTNEVPGTFPYRRVSFMGDRSTDIQIVNLTLRNFTPRGGSQAEALLLMGGRNLVSHVSLYSYQDTVQFNDSVYIADSYIEGETDFLWGRGPAFFDRCEIKELSASAPFMQIRSTAATHGFVFYRCQLATARPGPNLGRINPALYPHSEVVLIDCALGDISPAAYQLNGNGDTSNLRYWEFNSTNLSDGQPADVSRRAPWTRQLNRESDAEIIANYGNPTFVLGGWTPALAPMILTEPASQTASAGAPATFRVVAAGVPAPAYQWRRNEVPLQDGGGITGATTATLTLTGVAAAQAGNYTVVVTNASGSATSAAGVLTLGAAAP